MNIPNKPSNSAAWPTLPFRGMRREFRLWFGLAVVLSYFAPTAVAVGQTDRTKAQSSPASLTSVRTIGELAPQPRRTYIVTPGMGGTSEGDRFELLAAEIKKAYPGSNVYIVDWTPAAARRVHGIVVPWLVARSIDAVAQAAAEQLKSLPIDPRQLTLIGESFGNNVNMHIACALGQVHAMLAFNPANELGGGGKLDLKRHSEQSWAFHTRSPFDTCRSVSHRGILLHAPEGSGPLAQHTYGVNWLRESLAAGDTTWLSLNKHIPSAPAELYDLGVLADGTIDWEPLPRRIPTDASGAVVDSESSNVPAEQPSP